MKLFRLAVVAIFVGLFGVYISLLGPQPKSNAETFPTVNGNDFTITAQENQSCPNGQTNNLSSYGGSFSVTNKHNSSQAVHVIVHRFFCSGVVGDCEQNDKPIDRGTVTFGANQTQSFSVSSYSGNLACGQTGTYQADIEFVGFNSAKFQSAIWCHATPACAATPTPTHAPTVTPTPTTVQQHYACVNNACVLSTNGVNLCNINHGNADCTTTTVTPTITPTTTPVVTDTPTITPTPTTVTTTQECPSGYVVQIVNSQVFCLQQTQIQTQNQYQYNNQEVHNDNNNNTFNPSINLTSYAPTPAVVQVQAAPVATSLPSTGSPIAETLTLLGMLPTGFLIKKFTKLG